jgi:hypothetical protein
LCALLSLVGDRFASLTVRVGHCDANIGVDVNSQSNSKAISITNEDDEDTLMMLLEEVFLLTVMRKKCAERRKVVRIHVISGF